MQARYIQSGNMLDYVPETKTPAGTVIIIGSIVGITKQDIDGGVMGSIAVTGVYDVEKDSTAITAGGAVYWNTAAKKATSTATGNTKIGIAVYDAAAGSQTVLVLLNR